VIAESEVAATVATVPEKSPAIVPSVPAAVVQVGASDTVNNAVDDLTANHHCFQF
jgi:hypothetical protein